MRYFKSDNTAAVVPRNPRGHSPMPTRSGGAPTARTAGRNGSTRCSANSSAREVRVFAVSSGTAANCAGAGHALPPVGNGAHARRGAHRARRVRRAGILHGRRQAVAGGRRGREDRPPRISQRASHWFEPHVHGVQPRVLSITQATERGAIYTPAEIAALAKIAHERGMRVHVDGARFANALVAQQAARRPSSRGNPASTCCRSGSSRMAA